MPDHQPERTMPAQCPVCTSLLATTGEPHCIRKDKTTCSWLTCSQCDARINPDGRWFVRRPDGTYRTWADEERAA